jgi:flagellar basal body-associated protein FliL
MLEQARWLRIRFVMTIRLFALMLLCACVGASSAYASGGGSPGGGAKKSAHGSKAQAPKKQRPITSLESWVMVDPFSVTVVQDDRVRGKVLVSFGMDVPDADLRAKAELLMPRLQDTWLSQLSHYASTAVRPSRAANIREVSLLLQRGADQVLGKPGSKVLLGSVIINMN